MPVNEHLLRLSMTVGEYLKQVARSRGEENTEAYPVFKVAQCPFCNTGYMAYLDLHSLLEWQGTLYSKVPGTTVEICEHQIASSVFVDLHHQRPSEIEIFDNILLQVPFVIPECLKNPGEVNEKTDGYLIPGEIAVFHALPICRIEYGEFVPRYSTYIITYYSRFNADQIGHNVFTEMLSGWGEPSPEAELRDDLDPWIEKQQLWWLDPTVEELPLQHAPEEFPYQFDEGGRYSSRYWNGYPVRPIITPLFRLFFPNRFSKPEEGITRIR